MNDDDRRIQGKLEEELHSRLRRGRARYSADNAYGVPLAGHGMWCKQCRRQTVECSACNDGIQAPIVRTWANQSGDDKQYFHLAECPQHGDFTDACRPVVTEVDDLALPQAVFSGLQLGTAAALGLAAGFLIGVVAGLASAALVVRIFGSP